MFDSLNSAVMQTFAEPFTFKSATGDVLLSGILDEKMSDQQVGAARFVDRVYVLIVTQSAATTAGIALHDKVVVRDVNYQIIDMQADTGGMVVMSIRAY